MLHSMCTFLFFKDDKIRSVKTNASATLDEWLYTEDTWIARSLYLGVEPRTLRGPFLFVLY